MNPERPNFNLKPSLQEQRESIKSAQEIAWEQKLAEIDKIADKTGKGIDEKIKETVVAFSIHKFITSGSCEGHMNEEEDEHGLPYPWIEVYDSEPAGWKEAEGEKKEQLDQVWRIKNFKQQQIAMDFLAEFYQDRETPFSARLTFDRIGAFGGFRVQSFGAEITTILTSDEKKQKLELYQKEMEDFTNFLKSKYFSKE